MERIDWWRSPETGIEYPIEWKVQVPGLAAEFLISPTFPDQEMTTTVRYWEGGCEVKGRLGGRDVQGRGYMELVGYRWTTLSLLKWLNRMLISGLFNRF